MPYKVVKRGNKYLTINKQTGKIKGRHSSRKKAIAQMKLLYLIESGKKPKRSSKKSKK
jgi:hypothetical protein